MCVVGGRLCHKIVSWLTENMPKALLKLGDKTVLEMVTDKIDEVSDVENIYIVTNEKFYKQFEKWCESYKGPKKLRLLTTIQRVMITDSAQSVI